MKQLAALAFAVALLAQTPVFAEGKVEITASDSVASLLPRLVGQKVELHLRSGEKLAGKLESASANGVHLSNLAGQEFFDALIAPGDISAVVVRVR
jgi:hypothetical protein